MHFVGNHVIAILSKRQFGAHCARLLYNIEMADLTGKPPKSVDEIRSKLGTIQSETSESPQGPAAGGVAADTRIVIESFHNHEIAREFRDKLSRAGVGSWTERRARKLCILIDYEDRRIATPILDMHHRERPDQIPRSLRREFDFLIFCGAIGATIGGLFVFNVATEPIVLSAPIAFGLVGAILGHLVDRVGQQLRETGRFRFGMREFLIVSTLPALGVFIWHLIEKLTK